MSKIDELLDGLSEQEKEIVMRSLREIEQTGHSDTLSQIYEQDFEEIPVSIDEFIESPRYAGWMTNNGEGIYPYWRQRLREMFDPSASYQEVALTGCLTGDTIIPLLNGKKMTMKDLSDIGDLDEYVYSFDLDNDEFTPGHLVKAFSTGIKKVYRITLDNGESFEATSNHRFLTRDKHWLSIDNGLEVNDSMMPLYRSTVKCGSGLYETVKHPKKDGSYVEEPTHRMSMRYKKLGKKCCATVHHKDFNRYNNDPRNLCHIPWWRHSLYHKRNGKVIKAYMNTEEGRNLAIRNINKFNDAYKNGTASEDTIRRFRIGSLKGTKSRWSDNNEHEKMRELTTRRMKNGFSQYMTQCKMNNPDCVKHMADKMAERNKDPKLIYSQQISKASKIANIAISEYGELTEKTYNDTRKKYNFKSGWPAYASIIKRITQEELYNRAVNYNHRIVSIEYIGEKEVYDLTVEKYHNFCLQCGIVAHNSIGIGKSSIAIIGLAYQLYKLMCLKDPHTYYRIGKGGFIYVVFFNATLTLSQGVAYTKFQSLLKNSPWFMERGKVTGKKYLEYIPDKPIRFTVGSTIEHSLGKDIFCMSGDTVILTQDGLKKLEDIAGEYHRVYSMREDGELELSEPALICETKIVNELYEVELEDGSIIRCTGEHRLRLSNGKYKRVDELTTDDELQDL